MARRSLAALALVLLTTTLAVACDNGANSVDVCQELETLRCERAPGCGVDLSYPPHQGSSSADDIVACKLYYQDACLHGLATSMAPVGNDVKGCLQAISTSCPAVIAPETNSACTWLIPPVVVDAGIDSGVTDATAVTDVVVVTSPDTGAVVPDAGDDAESCISMCDAMCDDDSTCIMECEGSCLGT